MTLRVQSKLTSTNTISLISGLFRYFEGPWSNVASIVLKLCALTPGVSFQMEIVCSCKYAFPSCQKSFCNQSQNLIRNEWSMYGTARCGAVAGIMDLSIPLQCKFYGIVVMKGRFMQRAVEEKLVTTQEKGICRTRGKVLLMKVAWLISALQEIRWCATSCNMDHERFKNNYKLLYFSNQRTQYSVDRQDE